MISRFKSGEIDALQFSGVISGISIAEKAGAVQNILDKYGVLAIAPYSSLSKELAATVAWEKAGEVAVMPGEDPTGGNPSLTIPRRSAKHTTIPCKH